jgi:hypothetical protein
LLTDQIFILERLHFCYLIGVWVEVKSFNTSEWIYASCWRLKSYKTCYCCLVGQLNSANQNYFMLDRSCTFDLVKVTIWIANCLSLLFASININFLLANDILVNPFEIRSTIQIQRSDLNNQILSFSWQTKQMYRVGLLTVSWWNSNSLIKLRT